jgi:hypothetical protein
MRAFEILVALFSPVFFLAGRISPRSALGQNRGAQKTAARLTVVGELPEILVARQSTSPDCEAEEPHPGQPVAEVELGTLVGQVVLGLQDQDLEHQDVIERRPATPRAISPRHGPLELGPEQLELDHGGQSLEIVPLL